MTSRELILNTAKVCVCGDRDVQYGPPEQSFDVIAQLWNAYLGRETVDAKDVALMMALFKLGRMKTGHWKADNFIDCVGYVACAGELQSLSEDEEDG